MRTMPCLVSQSVCSSLSNIDFHSSIRIFFRKRVQRYGFLNYPQNISALFFKKNAFFLKSKKILLKNVAKTAVKSVKRIFQPLRMAAIKKRSSPPFRLAKSRYSRPHEVVKSDGRQVKKTGFYLNSSHFAVRPSQATL